MGILPLIGLASAVVFVEEISYSLIVPLLPTFAHQLRLGKQSVGLLAGSYLFGMAVAALPAGRLTDRIGPRAATVLGLAGLSGTTIAFGLARSFELLLLARVLQSFAGALAWAGAMAWLLAQAPGDVRGRVVGIALGAGFAGVAVGPLVGGLVVAVGFMPVLVPVALLAMSLCGVAARVPAPRATAPPTETPRGWLRSRQGFAGVSGLLVAALVMGAWIPLLPLALKSQGVSEAGIALVFSASGLAQAGAALLLGRLTDRVGGYRLLPIGLVSLALTAIALAASIGVIGLATVIVAGTLAVQLAITPSLALIAQAGSSRGVGAGAVWGSMNLTWCAGMCLGSVGSTGIAARAGDGVAWIVLAATCVGAAYSVGVARSGRHKAPAGGTTDLYAVHQAAPELP